MCRIFSSKNWVKCKEGNSQCSIYIIRSGILNYVSCIFLHGLVATSSTLWLHTTARVYIFTVIFITGPKKSALPRYYELEEINIRVNHFDWSVGQQPNGTGLPLVSILNHLILSRLRGGHINKQNLPVKLYFQDGSKGRVEHMDPGHGVLSLKFSQRLISLHWLRNLINSALVD